MKFINSTASVNAELCSASFMTWIHCMLIKSNLMCSCNLHPYKLKPLSFTADVKERLRKRCALCLVQAVPPMRVIHRESLLKFFLSLSLSHWFHCRADRTCQVVTLWYKKYTQKCLKLNPPKWTSIMPTRPKLDTKAKLTQPNQKSYLGAPNGEGGRTITYNTH
jgi:hypothetical protein